MKKFKLSWTWKQFLAVYFLIVVIGVLTGCADVINVQAVEAAHPYGFFNGLWHGIVAPFSIWGSLFWPKSIAFYGLINTGWWYNFGFLLGIGMIWGGGGYSIPSE
jgi:hypothetical protein